MAVVVFHKLYLRYKAKQIMIIINHQTDTPPGNLNQQDCKFSVHVDIGVYTCMTEQEYYNYKNPPKVESYNTPSDYIAVFGTAAVVLILIVRYFLKD